MEGLRKKRDGILLIIMLYLLLGIGSGSYASAAVCDADANGIVDQRDINLILMARNTPATGPSDPRDADHDGKITDLDVVLCKQACTLPNCAVDNPPVAKAGPNKMVFVGNSVLLDGSASSDADGDKLSFQWSLTSPRGSSAQLAYPLTCYKKDIITQCPSYIPSTRITVDANGNYTVKYKTGEQTQTIIISLSKPCANLADSAICISSAHPSFIADKPGSYAARLTVNDGKVSSSATVTVSTQNSPPIAKVGAVTRQVVLGSTVQLDGTGSTDVDGDKLTYRWSLISAPSASAVLEYPKTCALYRTVLGQQKCAYYTYATSTPKPTIKVDAPGQYIVRLIVNDGTVDSLPATLSISTENAACGPDAGQLFSSRNPDPKVDKLCSYSTPTGISAAETRLTVSLNPTDIIPVDFCQGFLNGLPICLAPVELPVDYSIRPIDVGPFWEWTCTAEETEAKCYSGGAVVLTVGGMSLENLAAGTMSAGLANPEGDDHYLYDALLNENNRDKSIVIYNFPWGARNPELDTPWAVPALTNVLRAEYEYAKKTGRKFVVVTHSWGSVLSYLALALESQGPDPITADLLITLSCPLGTHNIPLNWMNYLDPTGVGAATILAYDTEIGFTDKQRFAFVPPPFNTVLKPRVKRAYNFWAIGDWVSGPLQPGINALPWVDPGLFPGAEKAVNAISAYTSPDGGNVDITDEQVDKPVHDRDTRWITDLASTWDWHNVTSLALPAHNETTDEYKTRLRTRVMDLIRGTIYCGHEDSEADCH